jgi:CRP/FNR family cyclic AMP-dependent transcriptional regulator
VKNRFFTRRFVSARCLPQSRLCAKSSAEMGIKMRKSSAEMDESMKHSVLYEELPFLKDIDRARQEQFEEHFKSAPLWLMDAFQAEEIKKGTVFVREGEPADTVFFVVEGTVEAIDYRIDGVSYDYMKFDKVYALGGMEFMMDINFYMTTLRAVTNCKVIKISRAKFEKWMFADIRAMKLEAKRMGEYLLEEGRNSRLFLFLQGADRLAFLFTERYERNSENGVLDMKGNRQSLADETGLCVKSISRGIKKFSEEGMITKAGNRILINREQYGELRKMVLAKTGGDCK